MRSVAAALTWELLHRGRWWIPAAAFGAVISPLLLFGLLLREGAFNPSDPSMMSAQHVFMQIGMLVVGAAMFQTAGPPSRLFTRPISTPGIVLGHLLPAGLATGVVWMLCTQLLNSSLPLNWPVLGPCLFAAVAVPSLMAVVWLTEQSFWILPGVVGIGAPMGVWLKSRTGPIAGAPTHFWRDVTALDLASLAGIAVAAYFVGVAGVARQRRHDQLPDIPFVTWIEGLFDRTRATAAPFASPEQAQRWAEQSRKGWILPTLAASCLLIAFSLWLTFDRNHQALLRAVTGAGMLIAFMAGLIGAFDFHIGPAKSSSSLGPFLGTRPLSSTAYARCVTFVQFRSVAITIAIWLSAFFAAYFNAEPHLRDLNAPIVFVAAVIVGMWIAASIGSTVSLTGRASYFATAFAIVCFSHYVFAGIVQLTMSREARRGILNHAVLATIAVMAIAAILMTVWAFARATRRNMIERRTVVTAAIIAAIITGAAFWGLRFHAIGSPLTYLVAMGIAGLAVAPAATAPLAVAWNRSR